MISRKIGEIQASKCFINKDGDMHDFFKRFLEVTKNNKEMECRNIWKVVESDGCETIKRVIYGNDLFWVPIVMLDQLPKGYLVQENAFLIRLKLGWETVPVFFLNGEVCDLIRNDEVLELLQRFKKRSKCFGVYFNERERTVHYISEVVVTSDELMYKREEWKEILRGYQLFFVFSKTLGSFTLSLNDKCFSAIWTDEHPKMTPLAEAVRETCIPRE